MSDNLRKLQNRQEEFIDERGWDQFHMPKSLAMAISVESNELVELFQWHDNLPAEAYAEDSKIRDDVEDELADIVIYSLSMASAFDLDLSEVVETKLEKNEERFDLGESEEIREELSEWKREED
jgi:NTP pyrophosphatase (non-canonical NTP hydrolase)